MIIMCIAIPPAMQDRRQATNGSWHYLAAHAGRLFAAGALLQALLLASALLFGRVPGFCSLPLLFLALATLLLGVSLTLLARGFGVMAPSYPLYAGTFFLLMAGMFFTWIGLPDGGLLTVGQILLGSAWMLALRALRWQYRWARPSLAAAVRQLYWLTLALGGLVLALAVAMLSQQPQAIVWLSLLGLLVGAASAVIAWRLRRL